MATSVFSNGHPVSVQDSVYYLSCLASGVQQTSNDALTNVYALATAKNRGNQSKALNHLATLLSRGQVTSSNNETNRIVAVTATLLDNKGVNLWITSSPSTSPVSSPTVSPSSSSGSDGNSIASGIFQSPTPAAPWQNNAILASNSENRESDGSVHTATIEAGSDNTTEALKSLINLNEEQISNLSFEKFAIHALRLIRSASSLFSKRRDAANAEAFVQVHIFFTTASFKKIRSRVNGLSRTFARFDKEEETRKWEWRPKTGEIITPFSLRLSDKTLRLILERLGISPEDKAYPVNSNNIGLWFKAIVNCLASIRKAILAKYFKALVGFTKGLHQLLQKLPSSFWRMPSLVLLLLSLKDAPRSAESDHGTESKDENGDGDDDEDVLAAEWLPADSIPPICGLFHRMALAVCAWTAATQYLLGSPIAKSSHPVNVSIIDFPRRSIGDIRIDNLITHWKAQGGWTNPQYNAIEIALKTLPVEYRVRDMMLAKKGAVHCEAGLAASIAHYTKPHKALQAMVPAIVTEAFTPLKENFDAPGSAELMFPIGVAKNAAPCAKCSSKSFKNKISTSSSPARTRLFTRGCLPIGCPRSSYLEQTLLAKVVDMVVARSHLHGSRSSSPSSVSTRSGMSSEFETSVDREVALIMEAE
ncbi:hypothetical protein C8F04DRAFT_1227788 [Mycena alexandri]|uniref:Uncharacterized protein n=1 Tax=Mycena alexandri TaxID=1745969 RepID=A0AAD6TIQ4_9AGAR|nr:hypothetical protein C8F04DRAFT_1227788 [Mycena alexandri]